MGLTGLRLSQERWGVPGQPQVLHLSSGLSINLTAASWDCIHEPEASGNSDPSTFLFFSLLSFHRGFATLSSDEELADLDFLRQGSRFIIICNIENCFEKKHTNILHTYDIRMFGSRLIFQAC